MSTPAPFMVSIVGLVLQIQNPTPTPTLELTAIVDDHEVAIEKGCGVLEVLVQIQNVSSSDQALPILDEWTSRISVVDAHSKRSERTGGCSGGRDRNAGWLLKPGEFADIYCKLPVGTLLDDLEPNELRVHFECAPIESLSLIPERVPTVAIVTSEPTECRVVATPAIDLFSAPLVITSIPRSSRQRDRELREAMRRIVSRVWDGYETLEPCPPGCKPAPAKPPVRIDAGEWLRELDAVGRSQWTDDALYSMALAARSNGDETAARVFLDEILVRYPKSTGCARTKVLSASGLDLPSRSNGSF